MIQGQVQIIKRCKNSGEIIEDSGEMKNVVLDSGISSFFQRISTPDTQNSFSFYTIYLGDDYGDPDRWSIFNPEPPSKTFTANDQTSIFDSTQNWLYFVPTENLDISYPTPTSVQIAATLDGDEVMNTNFPREIDMRYTSATLRLNNVQAFSYKRFPIRSLSRSVTVEIVWTISLTNGEEYCRDMGE